MVKKIKISPDNDNWSTLSKINFNKIVSMGDAYSGKVIKDLRNPYWKNILESWSQYIRSFKIDNLLKVIYMYEYSPLLGNSQINGNGNDIVNECCNKGTRNGFDLIDFDGLIHDF